MLLLNYEGIQSDIFLIFFVFLQIVFTLENYFHTIFPIFDQLCFWLKLKQNATLFSFCIIVFAVSSKKSYHKLKNQMQPVLPVFSP